MGELSWPQAVIPLLTAGATLLIPGLLALAPARWLRTLPRLALAAPLSLAMIGVTGILDGLMRLPFQWWHVGALAIMTALACGSALWRRRRSGPRREEAILRQRPRTLRLVPSRILAPLASWLMSVAAFTLVAFHAVPSPDLFSQSYDNLFHLNATVHILETGDASSLTLRTLINTHATLSVYPAGWHTAAAMIVQLTGTTVPIAFNALAIAVVAVAWLPGLAWLTAVLAPARSRRIGVPAVLLLGSVFGFMPYALLVWGVLYPTFLAYAIFPSGIAIAVLLARAWLPRLVVHPAPGRLRWPLLATAVLWWLGAFFTHPRSLVSIAVFLAPLALWLAGRGIRRAWRSGGRVRRRMLWWVGGAGVTVITTAVIAVAVVYRIFRVAERPVSEHLNGPQAQAVQTVWQGVLQVLTQSALVGFGADATGPVWLLALAVLAGLVVGLHRPELRWLVAAWAIAGVLFALAAGSNDDLTKILTGLWYKDRYRLSALLPMAAAPLAALTIAEIALRARRGRLLSGGLATLIAIASWATLWGPFGTAVAHEYRLEPAKTSDFVDAREVAFLEQVAEIVPADERLLGDPWDGSALSWLYGGREPVFPHLNGQWDADRLLVASELPEVDTDPAVCAALDRLRVRYVVTSAGQFDGGDPSGNRFAGVHAAADAGRFTPVLSDGTSTLYRIDQCGGGFD